jgi:hypothetical protein
MPRPRKYPELGDIDAAEYKKMADRIRSNINYSKRAIKKLEEKIVLYKERVAIAEEKE